MDNNTSDSKKQKSTKASNNQRNNITWFFLDASQEALKNQQMPETNDHKKLTAYDNLSEATPRITHLIGGAKKKP